MGIFGRIRLGGIMIWGFESLKGILKRNSFEKIDGLMYASWYGNTFIAIIVALLLNDLLLAIFIRTVPIMAYVSPFLVLFGLYIYLVTRRAVFGVTKNNFVYAKLGRLLNKAKEVYEVPIKNIRYLDVKKILMITIVKLYFISDMGKFKKVKFTYSSVFIGLDRKEYKKNHKIVTDKLMEVQKVLDKGDF